MNRFLVFSLLCACSDYSHVGMDENADTATYAALEPSLDAHIAIRLDVYAESATDIGLLNQSFFLESGRTDDMELNLQGPIQVEGTLSGFQTNPTADVRIPGDSGGVDGQVRAFVPNSLMSYAVRTDVDGRFNFQAVPADNYTLAWIPNADTLLPFEIEEGVPLFENTVFNKTLSYEESRPVYGQITDDSGLGIPGISVQLLDQLSGIGGAALTTNNMGVFHTRLYAGEYFLQIQSNTDTDAPVPDIQTTLTVSEEALGEIQSTVQLTGLETVNADGQVLGAKDAPLGGVLVRFVAESVDEYPGAKFQTESTTGSNGRYSIPVLPGKYEVEFIPSHDSDVSPISLSQSITLDNRATELPTVSLPERPIASGRLLDVFGEAAPGTLIRAQEINFTGAVFETYTTDQGLFSFPVSEGKLQWTFIPKDPQQGAISFQESFHWEMDSQEVTLEEGQLVSGCIEHADGQVQFTPVEIRQEQGPLLASIFTDTQGCFEARVDVDITD